MIRWLFGIPLALVVAVGASSFFLLIASVADPVMAQLTGNTLFVGFWSLMDAIFAEDDPTFLIAGAITGLGKVFLTFLILPPVFVALIGEVAGLRRLAWYAGATGLLTALVPWLLRGSARVATPAELHVGLVLGLTGAVAGLFYWMVVGRSAGLRRRPASIPVAHTPFAVSPPAASGAWGPRAPSNLGISSGPTPRES
jgi:hypothetical protein